MDVFSRRKKETLAKLTKDAIGHLMTGIAASPFTLMEVVAAGPVTFRLRFLREYRGFLVDENVADLVFKFFCDQVVKRYGPNPAEQAKWFLDKVEVRTPPTAKEIEDSWVHEVYSTEDGRKHFYEDGAGLAGQDHKVIVH